MAARVAHGAVRVVRGVAAAIVLLLVQPAGAALGSDGAPVKPPAATARAEHHVDEVMVHDHAPRHGGVVAMSGTRHVEAALGKDGLLRVHLSDLHRTPLQVAGAHGEAIPRGATTSYPLVVRGDALDATLPAPSSSEVEVRVEITLRDGERLLVDFTLPVASAPR